MVTGTEGLGISGLQIDVTKSWRKTMRSFI